MNPVFPTSKSLRATWRARTDVIGWAYPADWHHESVDALCEALVEQRDPWPAAERLGRTRAAAAIGLAETLADVDALAEAAPGSIEQIRRAVSLGWSEVATAPQLVLVDPMTGLMSQGYLQFRLGEVYRAALARGTAVPGTHALLVCRVATSATGLGRRLPLVIVSEGIRGIFDAGETLAILSDAVMVVLCERTDSLARRAALARTLTQRLLDSDAQADPAAVRIWIEALPATSQLAGQLLTDLGR